jgi:hypothetical protein
MMALPAGDASLERLLRARAPGPPAAPDATPWAFLLRQPEQVLTSRVWPLVSRLLGDEDAVVRLRALEFVMSWQPAEQRLLEVARRHAALFADQLVDGIRLRERLQHAVANRCVGPAAPEIAPVLLSLLDGGAPSPATASVLGAHAPERAAGLAAGMGVTAAERRFIQDAVAAAALYHRDKLLDLLASLRERPADDRRELAAAADVAMERDDARAARLAAKVGLAAPRHPSPSLEQLRAALAV